MRVRERERERELTQDDEPKTGLDANEPTAPHLIR